MVDRVFGPRHQYLAGYVSIRPHYLFDGQASIPHHRRGDCDVGGNYTILYSTV